MPADSWRPDLLEGVAVLDDRTERTPASSVSEDRRLGRLVGDGSRPPCYRLWENGRALVVTAREARLPTFELAARDAQERGWDVVVRDSGGTAVPHGPGILESSLILPQRRVPEMGVERVYEALLRPVRSALRSLELETRYGDVPGSFCDGRFNLVTDGRKIAGTSQRWRGGAPPDQRATAYVVAHLVLFVDADMETATAAVNRFYRMAGGSESFDPGAVVTVAETILRAPPGRLTDVVRERIANAVAGPAA